jgi:hypothetical protein
MYNNNETGNWDKPMDLIIAINLWLSIANVIDLISEFILI